MKKRLLKLAMPASLLIYVAYSIAKRYVQLGETISIILCSISMILMTIALIYHGWCIGKGKNPYAK